MKRAVVKQEQVGQPEAAGTESTHATDAVAGSSTEPSATQRHSVTIKLAGKEYRLRSSASEPWLQQVAGYVDQAMQQVKERTDTVDSLDIALLTALNLAREVLYLREQAEASAETASDLSDVRLRSLIEQIESELPLTDSGPS